MNGHRITPQNSLFARQNFSAWFRILTFGIALLAVGQAGSARAAAKDQLDAWNDAVIAAQATLSKPDGPNLTERISELEKLRSALARERDKANAKSKLEPLEVRVAEGKLAMLGSVPDGGETEFDAKRRQELQQQLYDLEAPRRAYQESYLRIVATIADLDKRVNDLSYRQLTARATSPLWPPAWMVFIEQTIEKFSTIKPSAAHGQYPQQTASSPIMLSLAIVAGLVGLALAIFGKKLALSPINRKIAESVGGRRSTLLVVARDILGLLMPVLGLAIMALGSLFAAAVDRSLASLLPLVFSVGLPIVVAHWLGTTIFAPRVGKLRFVHLSDRGARRAVILVTLLGLFIGLESVLEYVETASPYRDGAEGPPAFLTVLATALALVGLANTLLRHRPTDRAKADGALPDDNAAEFLERRIDWERLIGVTIYAAGAIAVLVALIGYIALSRRILLPTLETLAVGTILAVTFARIRLIASVFGSSRIQVSQTTSTISQFLLALGLIILALPIFAMFWGLRPAEIGDFLILLRDGVSIGNTTISLGTIFIFIAVFAIGYLLTRWLQRLLQTALFSRLGMDEGTRSALITGIGYIGIMLSVVAAIGAAGLDLSNLAIIAGALSVGIGFGMQSVVANFVSGIILLIERPIKEGDSIEVGGYAGIVSKISVRATRIQAFNHDDVIIPNSEIITGTVRNRTLTDRVTRIECAVGIAYDADIKKAFDIVIQIANAHPGTIDDPSPNIVMEALGDSALLLRLYCFIADVSSSVATKSDIYIEIVKRFQQASIEIPFPHQDIAIRNRNA